MTTPPTATPPSQAVPADGAAGTGTGADADGAAAQSTPAGAARSRRWAMGAVAVVAAAAGAGFALKRFSPGEADLAGFWDRSFPTPDGGTLALSSLRGQRLLLNFWATWCPPCVEELPLLSAFYTQNKANGWHLLGLAVDKPAPVNQFLARSPVSFPVALAGMEGVDLSRSLGNAAGALPFSVLFDADGQIRQRKIGQLHEADLVAWKG